LHEAGALAVDMTRERFDVLASRSKRLQSAPPRIPRISRASPANLPKNPQSLA
jgi:hypothetical protein